MAITAFLYIRLPKCFVYDFTTCRKPGKHPPKNSITFHLVNHMRNPVWRCKMNKNKKVLLRKYFRIKYFVSKYTLYYFTQIIDKMSRLIPLFLQIYFGLFMQIAVRHENIVDKTASDLRMKYKSGV